MNGVNCLKFLNKSIVSYLQLIKSHQNKQVFAHVCIDSMPNRFEILVFNSNTQFLTSQEIKEILETFVDHLNRRSDDRDQTEIDTFRKSIEDLNTELSQKFEALTLNKMK